jgi:hypothetical protein
MPGVKRTFIVTSVIHFSKNTLSHSAVRSVFTPAERTTQTIKTVASIREKIPGAAIILLEMGKDKNIGENLISLVDKYVFIGNHTLVKWAVNGKLRGLGEAMGLIESKKELLTDADFYCKISGRYFLNEEFEPELWKGNFFLAKKYETGISTRLYGFSKELFADWQKALKKSLVLLYRGRSIEDVLPVKFGQERIHVIQKLGVSGFVAPDGEYLAE